MQLYVCLIQFAFLCLCVSALEHWSTRWLIKPPEIQLGKTHPSTHTDRHTHIYCGRRKRSGPDNFALTLFYNAAWLGTCWAAAPPVTARIGVLIVSPLPHITFDLCVQRRLLLSGFLHCERTYTHTLRSLGTAASACSFISCKPQETERQECLLCFVTL